MRIVAKFGGTSLGNGDKIENAAKAVKKAVDDGHEVVVVASAMGDTTDELLDEMRFSPDSKDRDEIVSMGERTSVRMLAASLNAKDLEASILEPGMKNWPIKKKDGRLDEEETEKLIQQLDIENNVKIVTGFLAEDEDNEIATLGRGGSDTTATILGKYLDADRVVIVTDVEGVLTGNPEIVESAHNVGEISIDVLRELSFKGAEVVAPSALSYKDEDTDVEVVHYQEQNLLENGTSVEGEFERIIDASDRELSSLTVAGREIRNQPGILDKITGVLGENQINIEGIGTGADSITMYVYSDEAEQAKKLIHNQVLEIDKLSSVTMDESIAGVRVVGGEYMDQPGVISEIVSPLAEAKINIHEMITSSASIIVFVDWEVREKTLKLIQEVYGEK